MGVPLYSMIEVLEGLWWLAPLSLIAALVATPICRAIAYRKKIVDRPDDLLKPHGRPVAYLGGLAMSAGLLVGLGAYLAAMDDLGDHAARLAGDLASLNFPGLLVNPVWNVAAIGLASLIITLVGLLDDLYDIRPRTKVLGQLIAAGILLVGGVGDQMGRIFFVVFSYEPSAWVMVPISGVLCAVAVVASCNATNLLDGLDGLCGGVTGIVSLGFLALAVWLAMWGRFPGSDELRIGLCLAMAGAVIGFLPYNIPPASIFMGDAGSMLLGFFVATMFALFCREGTPRWLLAALTIFALPILDTALAVVRRLLSGKSIFAGDRSHLYDQLVDRGMTVKQVVALFYVLSFAAAVAGVLMAVFLRGRYILLVVIAVLIVVWGLFVKLGMIRPEAHGDGGAHDDAQDADA